MRTGSISGYKVVRSDGPSGCSFEFDTLLGW
jgi:hypothetical protein